MDVNVLIKYLNRKPKEDDINEIATFIQKEKPEHVRNFVNFMFNMLCCSNKFKNLHVWIKQFLNCLQQQRRFDLYEDIVLKNIGLLFRLIISVEQRSKITLIILEMLSFIKNSSDTLIKVLGVLPDIILRLKSEADNGKSFSEDAKEILGEFVDLISALMVHYPNHNDLYASVQVALKDLQSSLRNKYAEEDNVFKIDTIEKLKNTKVGLVNLGKTCYMNSVLQVLAHTPAFFNGILLAESKSSLIEKLQKQIALMLYSHREYLTPSDIIKVILPKYFSDNEENDSSEFLEHVLTTLHEPNGDNGADCTTQSLIENTFTGTLSANIMCLTCGYKSNKSVTFYDLPLSFPEVKYNPFDSKYSVQDLLDLYCSEEKLDGDNKYFCKICGKESEAVTYTNVIDAPKILIVILKHFQYNQKAGCLIKSKHKVVYDEKISVKMVDETIHYDLYAGIVHSGYRINSGHYYTYAVDSTNKWHKFNDTKVTLSCPKDMCDLNPPDTPYVLFYKMRAESDVESSAPLSLEELPEEIRNYIIADNIAYVKQLKSGSAVYTKDSSDRKITEKIICEKDDLEDTSNQEKSRLMGTGAINTISEEQLLSTSV